MPPLLPPPPPPPLPPLLLVVLLRSARSTRLPFVNTTPPALADAIVPPLSPAVLFDIIVAVATTEPDPGPRWMPPPATAA